MPDVTDSMGLSAGRLAWMDVVSTDFDGTIDFYAGVMGWSCQPISLADDQPYATLGRDREIVAGAEPIEPTKGPPRWTIFIQVRDLDRTLKRAIRGGGLVKFPPTPLAQLGSLALLADADGATVGLWQAASFDPTLSRRVEGSLIGGALSSPAPDATARFYFHVFGWSLIDRGPQRMAVDAGGLSVHLQADPRSVGWTPVMGVSSLQATTALVRSHGGTAEEYEHGRATVMAHDSSSAQFLIQQINP